MPEMFQSLFNPSEFHPVNPYGNPHRMPRLFVEGYSSGCGSGDGRWQKSEMPKVRNED